VAKVPGNCFLFPLLALACGCHTGGEEGEGTRGPGGRFSFKKPKEQNIVVIIACVGCLYCWQGAFTFPYFCSRHGVTSPFLPFSSLTTASTDICAASGVLPLYNTVEEERKTKQGIFSPSSPGGESTPLQNPQPVLFYVCHTEDSLIF